MLCFCLLPATTERRRSLYSLHLQLYRLVEPHKGDSGPRIVLNVTSACVYESMAGWSGTHGSGHNLDGEWSATLAKFTFAHMHTAHTTS